MGHTVMNGKVITTPDTTTPSGHNDGAARDTYDGVTPNDKAHAVMVDEDQWATMVADHGAEFYARGLAGEHGRLTRETSEVKLALILVGARVVSADRARFQKGSGAWHKGRIAEFLGVPSSSRSLATELASGVVSLVEGGVSLYGDPSPEVVALALAYRETSRGQKKASASKGKAESEAEGESSPGGAEDSPREGGEDKPLVVADLVAALTEAHKVLDGLGSDRDGDQWAEVASLVDTLSDKIYE